MLNSHRQCQRHQSMSHHGHTAVTGKLFPEHHQASYKPWFSSAWWETARASAVLSSVGRCGRGLCLGKQLQPLVMNTLSAFSHACLTPENG